MLGNEALFARKNQEHANVALRVSQAKFSCYPILELYALKSIEEGSELLSSHNHFTGINLETMDDMDLRWISDFLPGYAQHSLTILLIHHAQHQRSTDRNHQRQHEGVMLHWMS